MPDHDRPAAFDAARVRFWGGTLSVAAIIASALLAQFILMALAL